MEKAKKPPMSKVRKKYFVKLTLRIIIMAATIVAYILKPEWFEVLKGMNFFKQFTPLHILWGVWIFDMSVQILPIRKHIRPLGSQKNFSGRFRPGKDKINYQALREHVITTTKSAYKVFLIWAAVIVALGLLYKFRVLKEADLFLASVFFYMCDLICVLIWCPFRLIMKNRCCTTCRIFNWDHLMMFSPLLLINSFFSVTLLAFAFSAWAIWELCVMMFPERFWTKTNEALKCSQCTDKLCTQYCQKLKK